MSEHEITYLTDVAMLTVVAEAGKAEVILNAARELGAITGAIAHRVNGVGAQERLGIWQVAVEAEREVLSILVATDQVDAVIDHIYRKGELDHAGAGYMFVTPVERAAAYIPKSMRERLEGK